MIFLRQHKVLLEFPMIITPCYVCEILAYNFYVLEGDLVHSQYGEMVFCRPATCYESLHEFFSYIINNIQFFWKCFVKNATVLMNFSF